VVARFSDLHELGRLMPSITGWMVACVILSGGRQHVADSGDVIAVVAVVAICLVAVIVAALGVWRRGQRRRAPGGGPVAASWRGSGAGREHDLEVLRAHVEAYREEFLRYALWIEVVRRGLRERVVQEVMGDDEETVYGTPVLFLYEDDWTWDPAELKRGVDVVLESLELDIGEPGRDPTRRASEACRAWAEAEACGLLDERACAEGGYAARES